MELIARRVTTAFAAASPSQVCPIVRSITFGAETAIIEMQFKSTRTQIAHDHNGRATTTIASYLSPSRRPLAIHTRRVCAVRVRFLIMVPPVALLGCWRRFSFMLVTHALNVNIDQTSWAGSRVGRIWNGTSASLSSNPYLVWISPASELIR